MSKGKEDNAGMVKFQQLNIDDHSNGVHYKHRIYISRALLLPSVFSFIPFSFFFSFCPYYREV